MSRQVDVLIGSPGIGKYPCCYSMNVLNSGHSDDQQLWCVVWGLRVFACGDKVYEGLIDVP